MHDEGTHIYFIYSSTRVQHVENESVRVATTLLSTKLMGTSTTYCTRVLNETDHGRMMPHHVLYMMYESLHDYAYFTRSLTDVMY
jgi:hypothetical protein